MLVKFEMRTW